MTCEVVKTRFTAGHGVHKRAAVKATVIVCQRGKKWPTCAFCKTKNAATQLCDGAAPWNKSRTCDAKMCAKCAVSVGHDVDLCPACFKAAPKENLAAALRHMDEPEID